MQGKDVRFLTGTDEHGLKMAQTAAQRGRPSPNSPRKCRTIQGNGRAAEHVIRRLHPHHRASTTLGPGALEPDGEHGDLYLDPYEGWYSVRDEAYYDEEETALGEERCAAPAGHTGRMDVEEKSYFFRLSAYEDRLLELYESHPDFVGPDGRRNEVISFVKAA